jgi:hypothetical protein
MNTRNNERETELGSDGGASESIHAQTTIVQLFRFFAIPRQRTFVRPKTSLITPKACSTLARTRDLARIYSARLLNLIAAPAMMPWTVADQSTEMSRQVTLIGKPYGGGDIDQVHIGEDK